MRMVRYNDDDDDHDDHDDYDDDDDEMSSLCRRTCTRVGPVGQSASRGPTQFW